MLHDMKKSILVVLCGILSAAVALPATNNAQDEKAVMATLEAMAQASIKKDIAALDKIYSADLTYSHSSAFLQNKAEVLKAAAGKGITESETFHDNNIRIYGNVALVRGVTSFAMEIRATCTTTTSTSCGFW